MNKTMAALAAAAGLFTAGIVALAGPAQATVVPVPAAGTLDGCSKLAGWYVNGDETDRKPTPTPKGLKFEGAGLIHHAIVLSTDVLLPGQYAVAAGSGMPDQPSFFSVEVRDSDGAGYATLRWNAQTSKWNMVTGGAFYENANATALVNMTSPAKSKNVISFGVGYTKNPPGVVAATIKSVSFMGEGYNLECPPLMPPKPVGSDLPPGQPKPSASVTSPPTEPTTQPPSSGSPSPDDSTPPVIIDGGAGGSASSLPVTGPGVGTFIVAGSSLTIIGVVLTFVLRRRKVTFSG